MHNFGNFGRDRIKAKVFGLLRSFVNNSAKTAAGIAILASFTLVACDGGGGSSSVTSGSGYGIAVFPGGGGPGVTPVRTVTIQLRPSDATVLNAVQRAAMRIQSEVEGPNTTTFFNLGRNLEITDVSLSTAMDELVLTLKTLDQSSSLSGGVTHYNVTLLIYDVAAGIIRTRNSAPTSNIAVRQSGTAAPTNSSYTLAEVRQFQVARENPGDTLQITLGGLNDGQTYTVAIAAIYEDGTNSVPYRVVDIPRQLGEDTDGDSYADAVDNCLMIPNEKQADFDGNAVGDACDPDADNDGFTDPAIDPAAADRTDITTNVFVPIGPDGIERIFPLIDIDRDEDGLIEIFDAKTLDLMRYSLGGTNRTNNNDNPNGVGKGCGFDGNSTCNGYELTMDIDLAGFNNGEWDPIGVCTDLENTVCASFTGVFEGNGFAIRNLNIKKDSGGLGLFSGLASTAAVRNLRLENVNIESTTSSAQVGALAGGSNARITNVTATGVTIDVPNAYTVGGLIGRIGGAGISTSSVSADSISGSSAVGGLVGFLQDSSLTSSWFVGEEITGMGAVGGLVGQTHEVSSTPEIILSSADVTTIRATGTGLALGAQLGGLVGYGSRDLNIRISYVLADSIEGSSDKVGGLVGHTSGDSDLKAVFVSANKISGTADVGGLIGTYGGTVVNIDSAIAAVNTISASAGAAGGLLGHTSATTTTTIDDSLVLGEAVLGSATNTGAFVGRSTSVPTIADSHWQEGVALTPGASAGNLNLLASRSDLLSVVGTSSSNTFRGWDDLACSTATGEFVMPPPDPKLNHVYAWNFGTATEYPTLNCFSDTFTPAQQEYAIFSGLNGKNDGDTIDSLEFRNGDIALLDNCPRAANPSQNDIDNDGQGDICDNSLNSTVSQVIAPAVSLAVVEGADTNEVVLNWNDPSIPGYTVTGAKLDYRRFDSTNTDDVEEVLPTRTLSDAEVSGRSVTLPLNSRTYYDFNLTLEFSYRDPQTRAVAPFTVVGMPAYLGKIQTAIPSPVTSSVRNLDATPIIGGAKLSWENPANPDSTSYSLTGIRIEQQSSGGARQTVETLTAPNLITASPNEDNRISVSRNITGLPKAPHTFYVTVIFTEIAAPNTVRESREEATSAITPVEDRDGDGKASELNDPTNSDWDNCPGIYNPNQQDTDNDEAINWIAGADFGGDACDDVMGTTDKPVGQVTLVAAPTTPAINDDSATVDFSTWTAPTAAAATGVSITGGRLVYTVTNDGSGNANNAPATASGTRALSSSDIMNGISSQTGLLMSAQYEFTVEVDYSYTREVAPGGTASSQVSRGGEATASVTTGNPDIATVTRFATQAVDFTSSQLRQATVTWNAPAVVAGTFPPLRNMGSGPHQYIVYAEPHGDQSTALGPGTAVEVGRVQGNAPNLQHIADSLTNNGWYVFYVDTVYRQPSGTLITATRPTGVIPKRLSLDLDSDGVKDPAAAQPPSVTDANALLNLPFADGRRAQPASQFDNCAVGDGPSTAPRMGISNPNQQDSDGDGATEGGDACDDTLDIARSLAVGPFTLATVTDESTIDASWTNPSNLPPGFGIHGGRIRAVQLDSSNNPTSTVRTTTLDAVQASAGRYDRIRGLRGLTPYRFYLTMLFNYTDPDSGYVNDLVVTGQEVLLGDQTTEQAAVGGALVTLSVTPGIKEATLDWTNPENPDPTNWEINRSIVTAQRVTDASGSQTIGPVLHLANYSTADDADYVTATIIGGTPQTTPGHTASSLPADGFYRFSVALEFKETSSNAIQLADAAEVIIELYADPDGDALTGDSSVQSTNALWDNCPMVYNPLQEDSDSDETQGNGGDACDSILNKASYAPTPGTVTAHVGTATADTASVDIDWSNPALPSGFAIAGGTITYTEVDSTGADVSGGHTGTQDLTLSMVGSNSATILALRYNTDYRVDLLWTYTYTRPTGGPATTPPTAATQAVTGVRAEYAAAVETADPVFTGAADYAPTSVDFTTPRLREAIVTWTAPEFGTSGGPVPAARRVGDAPSDYRIEAEVYGTAARADPTPSVARAELAVIPASATSYTATGLVNNGNYLFYVTAIYEDERDATKRYDSNRVVVAGNAKRLGVDTDGDGVKDVGQPAGLQNSVASSQLNTVFDNCLNDANPTQTDADTDDVGDACDDTLGGTIGQPDGAVSTTPRGDSIGLRWTNPDLDTANSNLRVTGVLLEWDELDSSNAVVSSDSMLFRGASVGVAGGPGSATIPGLKSLTSYDIKLTLQFSYTDHDNPSATLVASAGEEVSVLRTTTLEPSVETLSVLSAAARPLIKSAELTWRNPARPLQVTGVSLTGVIINATRYASGSTTGAAEVFGTVATLRDAQYIGEGSTSDITYNINSSHDARFDYTGALNSGPGNDQAHYVFSITMEYTTTTNNVRLSGTEVLPLTQLLQDDDDDGFSDDSRTVPTDPLFDNCPINANPAQLDADGDDIGNDCDLVLNGVAGQGITPRTTPLKNRGRVAATSTIDLVWTPPSAISQGFTLTGGNGTYTEFELDGVTVADTRQFTFIFNGDVTVLAPSGDHELGVEGLNALTDYTFDVQLEYDYVKEDGSNIRGIPSSPFSFAKTRTNGADTGPVGGLQPTDVDFTLERLREANVRWKRPAGLSQADTESRGLTGSTPVRYEIAAEVYGTGSSIIAAPEDNRTLATIDITNPADFDAGTMFYNYTVSGLTNNGWHLFYVRAIYEDIRGGERWAGGTLGGVSGGGLNSKRLAVDTDGDGIKDPPGGAGIPAGQAGALNTAPGFEAATFVDNCPNDRNQRQRDVDSNDIGDACDPNIDNSVAAPSAVTASNPTATTVDLSWTNPTLNGDFTITGASANSDPAGWSDDLLVSNGDFIGTLGASSGPVTVTGLSPNTAYNFRVGLTFEHVVRGSITNDAAVGNTTTQSITTLPDLTSADLLATSISAAPGIKSAVLSWTNPTAPTGFSIANVTVKAEYYGSGTSAGALQPAETVEHTYSSADTSHTFSNLQNNGWYRYSVAVGFTTTDAGRVPFQAHFTTPTAVAQITLDNDGDNIANTADNCPNVYNTDQNDLDGDTNSPGGIANQKGGDACDTIIAPASSRVTLLSVAAHSVNSDTSAVVSWRNPVLASNFTITSIRVNAAHAGTPFNAALSRTVDLTTGSAPSINFALGELSGDYTLTGLQPDTPYTVSVDPTGFTYATERDGSFAVLSPVARTPSMDHRTTAPLGGPPDVSGDQYNVSGITAILGITNTSLSWTNPTSLPPLPQGLTGAAYEIGSFTIRAQLHTGNPLAHVPAGDRTAVINVPSGTSLASVTNTGFIDGLGQNNYYVFSVAVGYTNGTEQALSEFRELPGGAMRLLMDADNDGVPHDTRTPGRPEYTADNCPADPNSDQADYDNDGKGNACDDVLTGTQWKPAFELYPSGDEVFTAEHNKVEVNITNPAEVPGFEIAQVILTLNEYDPSTNASIGPTYWKVSAHEGYTGDQGEFFGGFISTDNTVRHDPNEEHGDTITGGNLTTATGTCSTRGMCDYRIKPYTDYNMTIRLVYVRAGEMLLPPTTEPGPTAEHLFWRSSEQIEKTFKTPHPPAGEPTNVQVAPVTIVGTSANVTWDNPTVPPGYQIDRISIERAEYPNFNDALGDMTFTQGVINADQYKVSEGTGLSYTVTGLPLNKFLTLRLYVEYVYTADPSIRIGGISADSGESNFFVTLMDVSGVAPINPTVPGTATGTSADITWNNPGSNMITNYRIKNVIISGTRYTDSTGTTPMPGSTVQLATLTTNVLTTGATGLTHRLTGLDPNSHYRFDVSYTFEESVTRGSVEFPGGSTQTGVLSTGVDTTQDPMGDDDSDSVLNNVDVDDDGDGLIEIRTADDLEDINFNLQGTGLKRISTSGPGSQTGCGGQAGITACNGYELEEDIVLSGSWTRIGACTSTSACPAANAFSAIFEGNGHTISGLEISIAPGGGWGLFGSIVSEVSSNAITRRAEVRNLRLEVTSMTATGIGGAGDATYAGALAGYVQDADIKNVEVGIETMTLTNLDQVGGLVGLFTSTISADNVIQHSTVRAKSITGNDRVGGMVGELWRGNVISSAVLANTITGNSHVGGLVGILRANAQEAASIRSSVAISHTVQATSTTAVGGAGGLAGSAQRANPNNANPIRPDASIFDSLAVAYQVKANSTDAAGFVGQVYRGKGGGFDMARSVAIVASVISDANVGGILGGLATDSKNTAAPAASDIVDSYYHVGSYPGKANPDASSDLVGGNFEKTLTALSSPTQATGFNSGIYSTWDTAACRTTDGAYVLTASAGYVTPWNLGSSTQYPSSVCTRVEIAGQQTAITRALGGNNPIQ